MIRAPLIRRSTWWADVINLVMLRLVYREPDDVTWPSAMTTQGRRVYNPDGTFAIEQDELRKESETSDDL